MSILVIKYYICFENVQKTGGRNNLVVIFFIALVFLFFPFFYRTFYFLRTHTIFILLDYEVAIELAAYLIVTSVLVYGGRRIG